MSNVGWFAGFVLWVGISIQGAQADVYMVTDKDGSITLTNIYKANSNYQRVAREPKIELAKPTAPAATAMRASGEQYNALVSAAASENQLPEALIHAVISAESNYDPNALSRQGAAGLMQLMPGTARDMGVADVWDPAANIRGGARYLKSLMSLFNDDMSLALAAYNAGPGAVLKRGGVIPPYPETQRYVPTVLERFQRLQAAVTAAPM
ncbi:lytic transglycosylase domain-containing protein [Pseudomonas sp.]|uniref:lytic transglycosylase domain-containing protein n=1 Tax=Pseudomonas sp. TaxID=306 RepID=UPI00257B8AD1|nr:lytic transglycosylase domain-containing protein [Pseudomonas sp.]